MLVTFTDCANDNEADDGATTDGDKDDDEIDDGDG